MPSLIPPTPVGGQFGSYSWQDWYNKVRLAINNGANIAWSQITNFTGSNLNQLITRSHSDLQNILGPVSAQGHVPIGGSAGQFLQKIDGTVYNYQWGTLMPVANGGTGTATPALVAGTNVSITGSWPNQTINASVPAATYVLKAGDVMSGFLGMGSTPNAAWATGTFLGTQYGLGGASASVWGQNGANALYMATNYYYDGSEKRNSANPTAMLRIFNDGTSAFLFQVAASAAANSVITWIPVFTIDAAGNVAIPAAGISTASTTLHTTTVALANGAGVAAGTLTNAPAAGNPTKWISINDNGTIRKIPAW